MEKAKTSKLDSGGNVGCDGTGWLTVVMQDYVMEDTMPAMA